VASIPVDSGHHDRSGRWRDPKNRTVRAVDPTAPWGKPDPDDLCGEALFDEMQTLFPEGDDLTIGRLVERERRSS